MEEYWTGLFWNLAEGKASEYPALARLEIIEFYRHLNLWRKHLETLNTTK